jgi:hypothetical protein
LVSGGGAALVLLCQACVAWSRAPGAAATAWVVLLAWATSSALVTQSVVGLAYATALLPHAVAVWAIMRLRDRPCASILAGVAVWFLGWQAQELGRTVCLTYLVAVVGVSGAPMRMRVLWALIGGALLGDSLWHPSINTASFTAVGAPGLGALWNAVAGVTRRLFAPPWIDLPSLLVLGVLAACLASADRWLLRLVLLLHLGLTLVLALQRGVDSVWGRRFIIVDFYALVAVIAVVSEWMRQGRVRAVRAFVALLIVGALWQAADTVRFASNGFEPGLWGVFTMPFAHTTVDYYVTPQDVRWTEQLIAEARAGRRLILAYNFSSYAENATNPAAIPERLYLTLGPDAFARDVAFFGESSRWTELRARNPAEIDAFVDSITEPGEWVGWYALHPNDEWPAYHEAARHRVEVTALLSALERRFALRWEPPLPDGPSHIQRFTLIPRSEATASGR